MLESAKVIKLFSRKVDVHTSHSKALCLNQSMFVPMDTEPTLQQTVLYSKHAIATVISFVHESCFSNFVQRLAVTKAACRWLRLTSKV